MYRLATMHPVTDRQTDRQTDRPTDDYSRSHCMLQYRLKTENKIWQWWARFGTEWSGVAMFCKQKNIHTYPTCRKHPWGPDM